MSSAYDSSPRGLATRSESAEAPHRLTAAAEQVEALGGKLRARRKAIGKTLQQVAAETGLTAGFLSQVERGLSAPSLASLFNIARALGTTVEEFVSHPPQRTRGMVSRVGARPIYSVGPAERTYEFVEQGFPGALLNATITHVPPGYASEVMVHEGEEIVYVLRGEMVYEVDGIVNHLSAGDMLHFASNRPHRSRNEGAEVATELWVGTMKLFPE